MDNDDGVFNQGGKTLLLPFTKSGAGYIGTFDIGVKLARGVVGQPGRASSLLRPRLGHAGELPNFLG